MIKSNLPVILLKNLVLLPYQEVRIELKSELSKKITSISKLYHDSEVLVVCPINALEEMPDASDLPKTGVVGKIRSVIELPNKNLRVVIEGLYRVKVISYVNYSDEKDILDSIITNVNEEVNSEIEITAYHRKLLYELENYIDKNSSVSNSILSEVRNEESLSILTDKIANFLPLSSSKKFSLMLNPSSVERAKILIKEIAVENAVIDLENKIENDIKESLDNEQREYFLKEKIRVIRGELGETNSKEEDISKLKEKLSNTVLPDRIRKKINSEVNRYSLCSEMSPDASVIRNYIEYLLSIPWSKESSSERDLNKIEAKLNESHYGMLEAKNRIIEYMAVKSISSGVPSPIICLVGPPGVGKTTFASSIAKAVNRKFVKISLGGMSDSAELTGHRRAYIGSNPGKIISSLIKCGTNNPVFLLDEVDKIKSDYRGDPSSTLLDILDVSQNKYFIDNYIDEEVDLSKVLFILTANNINDIPQALLDRLEIIELSGYSDHEKLTIAHNYLIPILLKKHGLKSNSLKIDDNIILDVIENYTNESGVRELERCLSKIIRRVITDNIKKNRKINSIKLNDSDVSKYLSIEKNVSVLSKIKSSGVIKAVACSYNGGDALFIECASSLGSGKFTFTGSLGNVTKESIEVAIDYIKSNSEYFGIDEDYFDKRDIHIHFTLASVLKDGPSAGTAIVTAIISYIKDKIIDDSISMTGEITLKGEILSVGGIKEKAIACARNNISTLYIPSGNINDLNGLDSDLLNKIKFVPVSNYKEIFNDIFKKRK